jgi:serine protease Do
VQDVDAERARALNLREEHGVEITRVEEDSPAAKAGLKVGDAVLEFNGQRVEGTEQFVRLVRETPVGRKIKLTISRGGATQTLTAATEARRGHTIYAGSRAFRIDPPNPPVPPAIAVPRAFSSWRSPMIGIDAESLETQLAEYFGVQEGVLVRSVIKGSAADKAGLKAGDVITKVEGSKVGTPRDLSNEIRAKRSQKTLTLTVVRERKEQAMSLTLEDEPWSAPRGRSVHVQNYF